MSSAITMDGKVCIVTGANNGFGFVTSQQLAEMGATVVMVCRNQKRGEDARQRIASATGRTPDLLLGDLGLQADVKRIASEFRAKYERLDVLVNNAGYAFSERDVSEEGFEKTFALNYLAYFTLTLELVDVLIASAPSRIINTASSSHRWNDIAFDNLQGEKEFPVKRMPPLSFMYGWTNMMRIMFTYELAKRLKDTGVVAHAHCPGVVAVQRSGATKFNNFLMSVMKTLRVGHTPEEAAETIVYLATNPEMADETGTYRESGVATKSADQSYDTSVRERLWTETLELVGYSTDPLAKAILQS